MTTVKAKSAAAPKATKAAAAPAPAAVKATAAPAAAVAPAPVAAAAPAPKAVAALPLCVGIRMYITSTTTHGSGGKDAKDVGYTGDECATCGSMRMVRSGTCLTCQECGATSGGCS